MPLFETFPMWGLNGQNSCMKRIRVYMEIPMKNNWEIYVGHGYPMNSVNLVTTVQSHLDSKTITTANDKDVVDCKGSSSSDASSMKILSILVLIRMFVAFGIMALSQCHQ